jgi:HlyD family secretion protein
MEIIEKTVPGNSIIGRIFIAVLVLFISAAFFSGTVRNISLPRVTVAEVKSGNITRHASFLGKIYLENPRREYLGVPLKVEKVNAMPGDEVNSGTVVALLNKVSVDNAIKAKELDILKAKNDLDNSEYNLKIARHNLESFSEEAYMLSAKNNLDAAEINYERAREDLENGRLLFEAGGISRQELNNLLDMFSIASNSYNEAKIKFDEYKSSARLEKIKLENDMRRISGEVEIMSGIYTEMVSHNDYLTLIDIRENDYRILSKHNGVITELNLAEGGETPANAPLYAVDDSNYYMVEISASTKDASYIRENTEVSVRFLYNDIGTVKGMVSKVSLAGNPLDSNTAKYKVQIIIDKKHLDTSKVRLGDDVEVKVSYREFFNNIIPYSAIVEQYNDRTGKLDKYIYIIEEKKDAFGTVYKAKKTRINTGAEGDSEVQAIEGLNGDEKVIINPSYGLKDEESVVIE